MICLVCGGIQCEPSSLGPCMLSILMGWCWRMKCGYCPRQLSAGEGSRENLGPICNTCFMKKVIGWDARNAGNGSVQLLIRVAAHVGCGNMLSKLLPSDRVDMVCVGCATVVNYRIDLNVRNFQFYCNNCFYWKFVAAGEEEWRWALLILVGKRLPSFGMGM